MQNEHEPESKVTSAILISDDGKTFPLSERAVIGRSDPNRGEVDVDLGGLAEGGYVSRAHAEIWTADGKWLIKDLGSSNGTFLVSGEEKTKVEEETELADGQRLAFGTAELTFSLSSDLSDESDGANQTDEEPTEN